MNGRGHIAHGYPATASNVVVGRRLTVGATDWRKLEHQYHSVTGWRSCWPLHHSLYRPHQDSIGLLEMLESQRQ